MGTRRHRDALWIAAVFSGAALLGCAQDGTGSAGAGASPSEAPPPRAIKVLRPEKPLKIKIKKTAKGRIVWEVEGRDLEKTIRAAQKLRETFPD